LESQAKVSHDNSLKALRMPRLPDPLVEAAEQFASKPRPTHHEINCFKELFYALIFKADAGTKKKLSAALSRSHYTPRTLAIFLTMEAVETAAPLLMFSPALGERDLNAIVDRCPVSHLRVLARRSSLTASTVKKMLSRKDSQDMTRILLKKNTNLADDREIRDLLNMPVTAFMSHEQDVGDEREAAKSKRQAKADPVAETPGMNKLLELANKGGRISSQRQRVQGIYTDSLEQFEKLLLDNARKGSHTGFSYIVERRCNLEIAKTMDIIKRQDAGMLASLLCALRVSKIAGSQLLLLLNINIGKNISVFRAVTKEFGQLRLSECQAMFEHMGAQFETKTTQQPELPADGDFNIALRSRRDSVSQQRQVPGVQTIPDEAHAAG